MIDSKILTKIDLNDSMQMQDVFNSKKLMILFKFLREIINNNNLSLTLMIIFDLIEFYQIFLFTVLNLVDSTDKSISIPFETLEYFLPFIVAKDKRKYRNHLIIFYSIWFVSVLFVTYLIIKLLKNKSLSFSMKILNILNRGIASYVVLPMIILCEGPLYCKNGFNIYLLIQCNTKEYYTLMVFGLLLIFLYLPFIVIICIFDSKIGYINKTFYKTKVNCNYELYCIFSKLIVGTSFLLKIKLSSNNNTLIYFQLLFFIHSMFFVYYTYTYVFFYNKIIEQIHHKGWLIIAWYSFVCTIKQIFDIQSTIVIVITGWIVILISVTCYEKYLENNLFIDSNISDYKSLRSIEIYMNYLYKLINDENLNPTALGYINTFEENIQKNPEDFEKYKNITTSNYFKKKIDNKTLSIYAIIYILYSNLLEKSILKNDILLIYCYFLINKLKLPTYAMYLLSINKLKNYKHLFYKYILSEEIKDYFIKKSTKGKNRDVINKLNISSVILYVSYTDSFKLKIYEASTSQSEYFDIIRNNINTQKLTYNFLKTGERLLELRKDILDLWNKIIELNPFSDDVFRDFMLYVQVIAQDEILGKTEMKKIENLKNEKINEKNNTYFTMFHTDISSILLIDGYSIIGKIIYTTPNFPILFGFNGKEILNMNIDDIMPTAVSNFHKELISTNLKYQNLNHIFKNQKNLFIKGKNTGGIFNVNGYIKEIPDLSRGLIFIVYIKKIQDDTFIIIVDNELKVDGISDMMSNGANSLQNMNTYGLTSHLIGKHICTILPNILSQINYNNEKYILNKTDIDLKGELFSLNSSKEIETKINLILEKIKINKNNYEEEDEKYTKEFLNEYAKLINEYQEKKIKLFNVFYRIEKRSFLNDQYIFYKIYITKDLVNLNGKSIKSDIKKDKNTNTSNLIDNEINNISKKIINLGKFSKEDNKDIKDIEIKDSFNIYNINNKQSNNNFISNISLSSNISQSSTHLTEINKIKAKILSKKEFITVTILKLFALCFLIVSLVIKCIDNKKSNNNINDMTTFVFQNFYFNSSQIYFICFYSNVLSLEWIVKNYISLDSCKYYYNTSNCIDFHTALLQECATYLHELVDGIQLYTPIYQKILQRTMNVTIVDFGKKTSVLQVPVIDSSLYMKNLVYSLVKKFKQYYYYLPANQQNTQDQKTNNTLRNIQSLGINGQDEKNKKYVDIDVYPKYENSIVEEVENIMTNIKGLFNALSASSFIIGFNGENRNKIINENYSFTNTYFIISMCFSLLIFIGFAWILIKMCLMEIFYLERLIIFSSPSFDSYLKNLDEIKKKLKQDEGNEEEDKTENENQPQEQKGSESNNQEDDKTMSKKDKNLLKKSLKKQHSENNNEGLTEKEKRKKRKIKKKEENQKYLQKKKKRETMKKEIIQIGMIYIIFALIIILIPMIHYIVATIMQNRLKDDFIEFTEQGCTLNGIYHLSSAYFIMVKIYLNLYDQTRGAVPINMDILNKYSIPKFGNAILYFNKDNNDASFQLLLNFYQGDSCGILFGQDSEKYKYCSTFWSGILTKGVEQAMAHFSNFYENTKDELNRINNRSLTFKEIISNSNSSYANTENFFHLFFLKCYSQNKIINMVLLSSKISKIYKTIDTLYYSYISICCFIFLCLVILIHFSKNKLNSIFNFVGILPAKFIQEDEELFNNLIKSERYFI